MHDNPSELLERTPRSSVPRKAVGHARETFVLSAPSSQTAFAPRAAAAAPTQSLDHELKVWRMREAAKLKVAPFVLLLDATIRNIVEAAPTTPALLGKVRGMTAEVNAEYGSAICAVVQRHSQIHAL